jgi:hypothetical protein
MIILRQYMTIDIYYIFFRFSSFKEACSRPEGPYRFPMPWGPLKYNNISYTIKGSPENPGDMAL